MLSLIVRPQLRSRVDASLRATLRRQMQRAMRAAALSNVQVCLTLSDDSELHELNRAYAGEDHATDVLSFAQREQRLPEAGAPNVPRPRPPGILEPLGDIIVSVDTAQRQAAAQGHDLLYELLHLSVHGLCHLLGYDHATKEEEAVMFGYEARLRLQARGEGRVARVSESSTQDGQQMTA
jgi:probable rRNA maturation factor